MNFVSPLKLPDAFETGISSIDEEHKGLIAYLNDYLSSFKRASVGEFEKAFLDIITEFEKHFAGEEKLMEEACYDRLEEHARHHRNILAELHRLLESCRKRGTANTGDVIVFFQKIIDDVSKADLRFVDFLMSEDRLIEFKSR